MHTSQVDNASLQMDGLVELLNRGGAIQPINYILDTINSIKVTNDSEDLD